MINTKNKIEMVVMTVNRVEYLSKLVESINLSYAQLNELEKKLLKIKISDNGSSDGTASFLSELSKNFRQYEIVSRSSTMNGAEHLALIISECESEYLWIVGDDDLLEKSCLKNIINEVNVNSSSTDFFLLNFKQVDKDGVTVIKKKISNIDDDWRGKLNSKSMIGNGEFHGVFDMLFFIGSVVFKHELISIRPGDFDGTTDWEHLPVYLRSFVGKNMKIISNQNIVQRQRNHKARASNEKENSYRNKDIGGIQRLVAKLLDIHENNIDTALVYSMKAPYILHENVYYDFIDFLKLVCHPGTVTKLEDPTSASKVLEDLQFLVKSLPRSKDKLSILNYLRDIEELHDIFKLTTIKKKNMFEKMRVGGVQLP